MSVSPRSGTPRWWTPRLARRRSAPTTPSLPTGDCDDAGDVNTPGSGGSHPSCASLAIGQQTVPRDLRSSGGGEPRLTSGRDSDNNIIAYFNQDDISLRPSDAAMCWMFVSRLNTWAVAQ